MAAKKQVQTKPKTKVAAKPAAKPAAKAKPVAKARPEVKQKAKPAPKPVSKTAAKPVAKPAVKPAAKAAAKPASKAVEKAAPKKTTAPVPKKQDVKTKHVEQKVSPVKADTKKTTPPHSEPLKAKQDSMTVKPALDKNTPAAMPKVAVAKPSTAKAMKDKKAKEEKMPPAELGLTTGQKGNVEKIVKKMISRGKERGYITYDELNNALPAEEFSSDQIEDAMTAISDSGVVVYNEFVVLEADSLR